MFAAVINAFSVMVASLLGVAFKNRINEKYTASMLTGMAIVVGVIGVSCAIETEDVLSSIICMAIGTLCGEVLKIERHLENFGDKLKARFEKGSGQNSAFTPVLCSSVSAPWPFSAPSRLVPSATASLRKCPPPEGF